MAIMICRNGNGFHLFYAGLTKEELAAGKDEILSRPQDLWRLKREVENGGFSEVLKSKADREKILETITMDLDAAKLVCEKIKLSN